MGKRPRRNHGAAFKAKVALEAVKAAIEAVCDSLVKMFYESSTERPKGIQRADFQGDYDSGSRRRTLTWLLA